MSNHIWRGIHKLLIAALCCGPAAAQSGEERGFTLYERFDGTANTLGAFMRLDSTLGYNFNRFVALEAGLPVYFVRPSETALAFPGASRVNGIGNAHAALRLTFANPGVNYVPSLTVTAPTGDEAKGLSTGHVTYDWNNHFDRLFGRLMPYADIGIANSITDTPFFQRPFSSYGKVVHLEGGALLRIWQYASIGASAYTIEPSGEQTVVSRLGPPPQAQEPQEGQSQNRGRGRKSGVFELQQVTVGPAEIARDRGASAWIMLTPSQTVDFHIGYSRSATYALDTVFFGVGFNIGSMIRR
jgi:hypothetical protein